MDRNRKTAVIVGVLYIIGTAAGICGLAITDPVRNAPDPLVYISLTGTELVIGAVFVLLMGLSLAMIPLILFPLLKKVREPVALGYVVFRGGLETVTYLATAVSWLCLLPISRAYIGARGGQASALQTLGLLLLEGKEIGAVGVLVFCLGALMFYSLLYRSRLVPRWLSGWGIIAAVPYLAAGFLVMFGLAGSTAAPVIIMDLPLALQEMVLAVWLIVKGFTRTAIASLPQG